MELISTHNTNIWLLGAAVAAGTLVLGSLALVLRLRESLRETPDPKLTYTTLSETDKLRELVFRFEREQNTRSEGLRLEFKADRERIERQYLRTQTETHSLIGKNAQHIASLITQGELHNQRIHELSMRTDKLFHTRGPGSTRAQHISA